MPERVTLRPRRQLTLPREVCEALGIKPGDSLVLEVKDGKLFMRPQTAVALEALEALRQAIAESGVTLDEMLEGGRQVREEIFRERYGHLLEQKGQRVRKAGRRSA